MKKKILLVFFLICVLFVAFSTIHEKITYSQLSFDEKVLEIMNYDNIFNEKSVDKIVFIKEVEGGYFCVATSSEENLVNFGYIREEKGKLEFAGKSFSSLPLVIYNEDPTAFLRTSILNFSEKDYYYGCYQHKDDLRIMVNDSEVEIDNFTLNYGGNDFNMDFWLVCSDVEPTVKVIH
ncbi:MAG: hypothetical protein ACI4GB_04585 [Acutalibacteraceae bacterium]